MNENSKSPAASVRAHSGIGKTALGIFLFCGALTGMLAASDAFLLPRLTQVEVGGVIRDLPALREYHASLLEDTARIESQRRALILPVTDEQYRALIATKYTAFSFPDVVARIRNIAGQFSGENGPAVFLHEIDLRQRSRTVELRGEVRDVGSRSMTVLAQFTESLGGLPMVQSLNNPQFTREFSEGKGFFSPFVIHLVLR